MKTDSSQKDRRGPSVTDIVIEVPPVLPPATPGKKAEKVEESSAYVPHGSFSANTPSYIPRNASPIFGAGNSGRHLVNSPISYVSRPMGLNIHKTISQRSFLDPHDHSHLGTTWGVTGRHSWMKGEDYGGVETPQYLYPRTPSAYGGSSDGNYLFQTSLSPEEVNELMTRSRVDAVARASPRYGSYYGADGGDYGYKPDYALHEELYARNHWGSVASRNSWSRSPNTPIESHQYPDASHFAYLDHIMPSYSSRRSPRVSYNALQGLHGPEYIEYGKNQSWSKGNQKKEKKGGKNEPSYVSVKGNAKGGKAGPQAGANSKGKNNQQEQQKQHQNQEQEQKGGKGGKQAAKKGPAGKSAAETSHGKGQTTAAKNNKKKNFGFGSKDEPTTVMLRNIPNKYEQAKLLDVMKEKGFTSDKFDFFYLPIDFRNRCCVGYAFINFRTHQIAKEFENVFSGYKLPMKNASPKICEVNFARIQGRKTNLDVYRNSALAGIPIKKYRPLCFDVDGNEIPLPSPDIPIPSVQLRAAKIHRGSKRKRDKAKKSPWTVEDMTNEVDNEVDNEDV